MILTMNKIDKKKISNECQVSHYYNKISSAFDSTFGNVIYSFRDDLIIDVKYRCFLIEYIASTDKKFCFFLKITYYLLMR